MSDVRADDELTVDDYIAADAAGHGRPQREDGHRAHRDLRRAGRRHDAGRGQHPALRPAARRRLGGARRDPRLGRLGRARAPGQAVGGRRHQRDPPPLGHLGHGHRRRDRRSTSAARRRPTRSSSPTSAASGSAPRGSPARCCPASASPAEPARLSPSTPARLRAQRPARGEHLGELAAVAGAAPGAGARSAGCGRRGSWRPAARRTDRARSGP